MVSTSPPPKCTKVPGYKAMLPFVDPFLFHQNLSLLKNEQYFYSDKVFALKEVFMITVDWTLNHRLRLLTAGSFKRQCIYNT